MILSKAVKEQLQSFAYQILHDPAEITQFTTEQLMEIVYELSDLKIAILADICKHETAVSVSLYEPESPAVP